MTSGRSSPGKGFLGLPAELRRKVFSYTTQQDLYASLTVCKALRKLVEVELYCSLSIKIHASGADFKKENWKGSWLERFISCMQRRGDGAMVHWVRDYDIELLQLAPNVQDPIGRIGERPRHPPADKSTALAKTQLVWLFCHMRPRSLKLYFDWEESLLDGALLSVDVSRLDYIELGPRSDPKSGIRRRASLPENAPHLLLHSANTLESLIIHGEGGVFGDELHFPSLSYPRLRTMVVRGMCIQDGEILACMLYSATNIENLAVHRCELGRSRSGGRPLSCVGASGSGMDLHWGKILPNNAAGLRTLDICSLDTFYAKEKAAWEDDQLVFSDDSSSASSEASNEEHGSGLDFYRRLIKLQDLRIREFRAEHWKLLPTSLRSLTIDNFLCTAAAFLEITQDPLTLRPSFKRHLPNLEVLRVTSREGVEPFQPIADLGESEGIQLHITVMRPARARGALP